MPVDHSARLYLVISLSYAALSASVPGYHGSGTGLVLRVLLFLIAVAVLSLFYALRGHGVLQAVLGLSVLGVVTFFVVRAQVAAGAMQPASASRAAASLVPQAPATCRVRTDGAADAGDPRIASTEPEDFGYPVQTVDRIDVRNLLIAGSFDSLDSLLTAYSDSARRDFRLEYRMDDAFAAFNTASPTLESFIDDWVRARPASGNALIVRAIFYTAAGWNVRGGNAIDNTAHRRLSGANGYFSRAVSDLRQALRVVPCSLIAYKTLMAIAPYTGDTTTSRAAMDQALLIQPYSFLVRERHMLNLRPRWGGSYESMDRLAQESDSLVSRNPRLGALHGFADWDRADVAERKGDLEGAVELYSRALSTGDLWRFRLDRGRLYHRAERDNESLADLERALVQRPQVPELLHVLATTKYELGRQADGAEQHRLFYETYGDESLALLLEPADEDFQESMDFYNKNLPEYRH